MKIVIVDYELENYICTNILDGRNMEPLTLKRFRKWLLSKNDEIYFIDVQDKTWDKFKTKNSKRLELTLDELNELINKSSFLFLIKRNYVKSCMYFPKNN